MLRYRLRRHRHKTRTRREHCEKHEPKKSQRQPTQQRPRCRPNQRHDPGHRHVIRGNLGTVIKHQRCRPNREPEVTPDRLTLRERIRRHTHARIPSRRPIAALRQQTRREHKPRRAHSRVKKSTRSPRGYEISRDPHAIE
ncbi:MAG: hypothetical protein EBU32_03930 [Opitutaceae bacterium]|nr:hypothetical protein [Opitutaceae bacterium]